MSNIFDLSVATQVLADPSTSAADLSTIAQHHPSLRVGVAQHPSAYEALLDWLVQLGDPEVTGAVEARRAGLTIQQPTPPDPTPLPDSGPPTFTLAPPAAPGGPPPGWAPPGAPAAKKPAKRTLLVGAGALVVVLALVVGGIATGGFGLMGSGGARSAQAEAIRMAGKVESFVNSFNAGTLANNPLSGFSSLSNEFAPSEAALTSSVSMSNLTTALGLTKDTLKWTTDLVGVFTIKTKGLQASTYNITDDIAMSRFTGGTITVTADLDKYERVLRQIPDIADKQLKATLDAYGLTLNKTGRELVEEFYSERWVADAVNSLSQEFPLTIDLAQEWQNTQDCIFENPRWQWSCTDSLKMILVKEGGKWYFSSLLTSAASNMNFDVFAGMEDRLRADWGRIQDELPYSSPYNTFDQWYAGQLLASEWLSLFDVGPSSNKTPVEAAEAFARALASGDERGVLRELPTAERRYAAFSSLLEDMDIGVTISGTNSSTPSFSEISKKGDWATVRIEDLMVEDRYDSVSLTNGTCLEVNYAKYCLSEYINNDPANWIGDLIDVNSRTWAEIGMDPFVFRAKAEVALRAAMKTIDPNKIGVVAIRESGSWHISVVGTVSQLETQAMDAIEAGLKAARK